MQLACLHAVAGRLDDALTALKSAAGAGVDPVAAAREEESLGPLRTDPRLPRIVR